MAGLRQAVLTYEDYSSCVPAANRHKLDKEVDFGHYGVEKDLTQIADLMLNWDDVAPSLGLIVIEISDIQSSIRSAALQKYVCMDDFHMSSCSFFNSTNL